MQTPAQSRELTRSLPAAPSLAPDRASTLTIPEAARLLGVGRNLAYETAAREGELAGVPIIRVGRRILLPRNSFLAVLGLVDTLE